MMMGVERDSIVRNIFAKVDNEFQHNDLYGEHDGWRRSEPDCNCDDMRILENEFQGTTRQVTRRK